MKKTNNKIVLYLVAIGLFSPIFFQLASGVFYSDDYNYSSLGKLTLLPIPFSIIICYSALIYFRKFIEVRESLLVLFFTVITMVFATVILSLKEDSYNLSKFVLLLQFVLPMFALVVGQQYGSKVEAMNILGVVFFCILAAIVPLQLLSTITSSSEVLSPSIFIFSIYQHLQYVPVIFVSMFLFVIFISDQIPKIRRLIPVLAILMGVYAGLSASLLAISLLVTLPLGYILYKCIRNDKCFFAINTFFMIILGLSIFIAYTTVPELLRSKFIDPNESVTQDAGVPVNVTARVFYWKFYFSNIFSNTSSLFLGHLETPNRNIYPSAHNYYLDFIYNFGALALLPLLGLISYTALKTIQKMHYIWQKPELLCLVLIIFFLLFIDNSLKVGLRQPYPGIVSFFMWGVLLAFITDKKRLPNSYPNAEDNFHHIEN
ncbi:MAG: hypothetical protein ACTS9Y_12210 [Methylophilus sp.]|uniref:hypothetical protein n=1 Tax=Methylophilus sp. TaxID=29541 RepID=UPI003FA19378